MLIAAPALLAGPVNAASPALATLQSQQAAVVQQMSAAARAGDTRALNELTHRLQMLRQAEEQLKKADQNGRRPQ